MLENSGAYAVKRRKKPVPKTSRYVYLQRRNGSDVRSSVKRPPVKTSPSKRHRDRLNVELEQLTSLLPFSEEVRGRLDKLSVLRLSVGYLKVKSYFHATFQKNAKSAPVTCSNSRNGRSVSLDGVTFSEGELLLQALNGFVLVVTADGTIFYTSSTIQDVLGYHQSDVVHQSVYELVHMDDREIFKCQLHFALDPSETDSDSGAEDAQSSSKALSKSQRLLPQHIPPEDSSFLERIFCCRLRCLLDNTSGFLALNFKGRLKYLHSQGNDRATGYVAPPQLALFAIATPVQPPSVMEIRTKTLLFQTKHRMDFAPMAIDGRGKLVLGYTESELLTTGSGYQFIHAADMMNCADNHLRMIKTGESGFTIFRLLTKTRQWLWVQASARVVFKGGRPDFIIARQKVLTNEEGEEHLRQRRQQLPFNLATGEGVLYDMSLDAFSTPASPGSDASGTVEPTTEKPLDPGSLLGALRWQGLSVYAQPQEPSPQLQILSQIEDPDFEQSQSSLEEAFLDTHALLSVPGQIQTSQKRSVTGDHTSEAMIDSLEQILEDLRDGGLEGLEVEETEVRDWENTLVRMNKGREDTSRELNHILANDVFSYVEEALRSEFGGYVQASDQTLVLGTISTHGQHAGFSNHELQWKSNSSGSVDQTQWVNILGGVGNLTEPKVSHAHTLTPTQCCNTRQGHTSSLWPTSSSNHQSGNQSISTQLHVTPQSTLSSAQITNSMRSNHSGSESTATDPQRTYMRPQFQGPSAWQEQQQLPQSFHCHSLAHSLHTHDRVKSTDQSFHPQMQQLSSSCTYEKREGHIPDANTVPSRQTGPLVGPAWSRAPTHVARSTTHSPPFKTHPGMVVTGIQEIMRSSSPNAHMAACPDVANISLGHLSGDNGGLGTTPSDYATENGSLQSSFLCWNREAQIPLNGTVLPAQSINISQNTGP